MGKFYLYIYETIKKIKFMETTTNIKNKIKDDAEFMNYTCKSINKKFKDLTKKELKNILPDLDGRILSADFEIKSKFNLKKLVRQIIKELDYLQYDFFSDQNGEYVTNTYIIIKDIEVAKRFRDIYWNDIKKYETNKEYRKKVNGTIPNYHSIFKEEYFNKANLKIIHNAKYVMYINNYCINIFYDEHYNQIHLIDERYVSIFKTLFGKNIDYYICDDSDYTPVIVFKGDEIKGLIMKLKSDDIFSKSEKEELIECIKNRDTNCKKNC